MNKKELALLEKAFAIEVSGALNGYDGMLQTKSKLAEKLVADGYLASHTIRHGGQFPVISHGYRLTLAGHLTYCLSCEGDEVKA